MFSPPRVTHTASKVGLRAGFALDLTEVDGETGEPWDLNDPEMRDRALKLVDEQQPFSLVGCPPWRPFFSLCETTSSRMNPETRKSIIREGIVHLMRCI